MTQLAAICPACGQPLQVYIDDSSGPPSEAGAECECGAIPVFQIDCEPTYYLGPLKYDERDPRAAWRTAAIKVGETDEGPIYQRPDDWRSCVCNPINGELCTFHSWFSPIFEVPA